jgi:hypothetical protein
MEKEEKIEEKNLPQIMLAEKEIKHLIAYITLPSSLEDIKIEELRKSKYYEEAQEIIKKITSSDSKNKVKLRDFLRENILDGFDPFEITINQVISFVEKSSLQEENKTSSNEKIYYFTQQFFENKEAVSLYQNAILQICLGDSEGYLNFGIAISKLHFQELEDKKIQAKITKPFIQKYLEKTEEKYNDGHRGLQIPPDVELSLFDVLFYSLEQDEQFGKWEFYKNLYKEKFTGLIEYLLKPETFDHFKEKLSPNIHYQGYYQGVNPVMCSLQAILFKSYIRSAWRSLGHWMENSVRDEYALPAAYEQYISTIIEDYGSYILEGKFYFGKKRKIEQLFSDVKGLQAEVKGYEEKFRILSEHIKSQFSTHTQNELEKSQRSLRLSVYVEGLSRTLKGIELYENSEDKTNLPDELTENTSFLKEWK